MRKYTRGAVALSAVRPKLILLGKFSLEPICLILAQTYDIGGRGGGYIVGISPLHLVPDPDRSKISVIEFRISTHKRYTIITFQEPLLPFLLTSTLHGARTCELPEALQGYPNR